MNKDRKKHPLYLFRKKVRWSLEMLGEELGVTKQTIFNYEHYKHAPSAKVFYKIQLLMKRFKYRFKPEEYL